jgi:hypothetical protein
MNSKDEYLVYLKHDGSKLYYKNKKLHRESGPAIVIKEDIDKYAKLLDENLYTETDKPVEVIEFIVGDTAKNKVKQLIKIGHLKKRNPSPFIISFEQPLEYSYENVASTYWLEGKNYSKEEFTSIMLKKEMEAELPKADTQPKKLKV